MTARFPRTELRTKQHKNRLTHILTHTKLLSLKHISLYLLLKAKTYFTFKCFVVMKRKITEQTERLTTII